MKALAGYLCLLSFSGERGARRLAIESDAEAKASSPTAAQSSRSPGLKTQTRKTAAAPRGGLCLSALSRLGPSKADEAKSRPSERLRGSPRKGCCALLAPRKSEATRQRRRLLRKRRDTH